MLESIDPSEALKLEGVIDFVSSTDVPGLNDVSAFTCAPLPNSTKIKPYQPVFVPIGQEVVFVGQPLGLILQHLVKLQNKLHFSLQQRTRT